jgi:predicted Zn-dependent protease
MTRQQVLPTGLQFGERNGRPESIMQRLKHPDSAHLEAAQGWLELGNWLEANEELERIAPLLREHHDVLRMRVEIYSAAKKWDYAAEAANALCRTVPDDSFGYLRLAFALHELKRTKEAHDALLPVADQFPELWVIPYNLACYTCVLGDLVGARDWLAQAFRLGDAKDIKLHAMNDPDLGPLFAADQSG